MKQQLRKLYLQKRRELSEAACANLSERLCENFFKHVDLTDKSLLHTFLPIIRNKEPDTWRIINAMKKKYPHVKVAIPKINSNNLMESFLLESEDQLTTNSWGIPEPAYGTLTHPEKIDVVLVPLLVFDKKGRRVGYGKGYYDRFLLTCRKDCLKIGLSFFDPIEEIHEVYDHDVPLDKFITPRHVYEVS